VNQLLEVEWERPQMPQPGCLSWCVPTDLRFVLVDNDASRAVIVVHEAVAHRRSMMLVTMQLLTTVIVELVVRR